jgi:hypothetical protein
MVSIFSIAGLSEKYRKLKLAAIIFEGFGNQLTERVVYK